MLTRSTTPIQNQQEIYSFNSLILFTREKSHVFQHPRVDTGKKKFAMNLSLHFSSIRFRSTAHGSSFASRYIDPPTFDEYLSTRSLFFPSSILPRVYHRSSFFLSSASASPPRPPSPSYHIVAILSFVQLATRCFPPTPFDTFVSSLSLSLSHPPSIFSFPLLFRSPPFIVYSLSLDTQDKTDGSSHH